MRISLFTSCILFALTAAAGAETKRPPMPVMTRAPAQPVIAPHGLTGHTLYVNRCIGGCTIGPGQDNATTDPPTSQYVSNAVTIPEFDGFQPGDFEGALQCLREVYSPFNVNVVETRPTSGDYSMIMVGGTQANPAGPLLGFDGAGGVAGLPDNCQPNARGMSFAFTELLDVFAGEAGGSRPFGLCWVMAQETAHVFGLDHEFQFQDDQRSACNDPMTYRDECGGQKFFRNKIASCGEFAQDGSRSCRCPPQQSQNSHQRLLAVFGPGTSLVPPPTNDVTTPAIDATAFPTTIITSAGSKRGIEHVDFYFNNYKWGSVPGQQFGRTGQQNPSTYSFGVPATLPDSIYDIRVEAYDDLGAVTTSRAITLTKGAPCATADTCLAGQKCEAGKCFWDEPVGIAGDACTFPQFCTTGICEGPTDAKICTTPCVVGVADSCEEGFRCLAVGNGGVCYFNAEDGGGCCSSSDGSLPAMPLLLGSALLGFVVLRRRR
ncbi:MAG: hypothetical protein ABI867_19940 [Kofleriaceae bacterium]